mgnify:FL=1
MTTIRTHRKSFLNEILLNLCENFCDSGYYDFTNKKAYAETDSEIAADALEEVLYDLGYMKLEDTSIEESETRHYSRKDVVENGAWKAVFKEL